MMKRTILFLISLVVLVSWIGQACTKTPSSELSGGQGPTGWQEKWDKTLAAAKQEGSVRMYIIMTPPVREGIATGFKQKYGIEVEYVAGPPADISRRFVTERDAGQSLADIFNAGGTTLITVIKPKGILTPFAQELLLPEVTDPKSWHESRLPYIDKDGYVVGMIRAYQSFVLRNTELVKDGEITSFKDLLDPKWKEKMVINDPSTPGAGASFVAFLAQIWGEDEAKEYLRGLVKQEVVLTRDWRQQVEWVARGKYPIGIAANTDNISEFLAVGAPIAPIKAKEGSNEQTTSAAIGLPTNPPHPNARTVFINWLLSKDGQTAVSKSFGYASRRADVSMEAINPIFVARPGDKIVPETEEHFLLQARMFPAIREIFAPLLK